MLAARSASLCADFDAARREPPQQENSLAGGPGERPRLGNLKIELFCSQGALMKIDSERLRSYGFLMEDWTAGRARGSTARLHASMRRCAGFCHSVRLHAH